MKRLLTNSNIPIVLLLIFGLALGLLSFRDYGLTWDEPLFYQYGNALGYAYSPSNWFSGHFDLNQSYGPSADDHKNRGPAYLLLAREPVYLIEQLHLAASDAWHLVNFLTFLIGVYFLYRICERFVRPWAAFAASAMFASQPLLWGHAYINPKDMPFLVFFTGAVWLGLRMVDKLADANGQSLPRVALLVVLPAILLGIATSNRVLGPLAGALVVLYFVFHRPSRRTAIYLLLYAALALMVMLATWPYLWESPLRFAQVMQFMADNPTVLPVLFGGQVYRAYDLPHRYLAFYLLFSLTEFVWPLFAVGLFAIYGRLRRDSEDVMPIWLLLLVWFVLPLAYAIGSNPPMYDGMRHFLFILPPVFVLAAIAFQFLFEVFHRVWINVVLLMVVVAPGVWGIVRLHPYEYTYYNAFIGGTGGAFRRYETDYWLTCYKEAVQELNQITIQPVILFVHREADAAAPYAAANVSVLDERGAVARIQSGDYILVNTRTNEDRSTFHDAPTVFTVGRDNALFCVVKRIP